MIMIGALNPLGAVGTIVISYKHTSTVTDTFSSTYIVTKE
jgi:hypothetical protein